MRNSINTCRAEQGKMLSKCVVSREKEAEKRATSSFLEVNNNVEE
jgi:hypothetical protein